jgi:hypothetical protein
VRAIRLVLLTVALLLTGCEVVSGTAVADDSEFAFGEAFVLPGGHEARNAETGLALEFSDVLEDSRCPTRVNCFWTGQARIRLTVTRPGHDPTTVEFNTNPAPGLTVESVRVDDVTIDLRSLDPYPETPEDGLTLSDYRATLVVTRG